MVQKKRVLCCAMCGSHKVRQFTVAGKKRFTCDACGYIGPAAKELPLEKAKLLLHKKRLSAHKRHVHVRLLSKNEFFTYFNYRLWFRLLSLSFACVGLLFLASSDPSLGVLFLVVGIIGLVGASDF